ncbi:MAG: hypothetical protein GXX10_04220 [Clostridiaceae bacterium]|nr:hypothetical protein [Clostridiaceae bacterium]
MRKKILIVLLIFCLVATFCRIGVHRNRGELDKLSIKFRRYATSGL